MASKGQNWESRIQQFWLVLLVQQRRVGRHQGRRLFLMSEMNSDECRLDLSWGTDTRAEGTESVQCLPWEGKLKLTHFLAQRVVGRSES